MPQALIAAVIVRGGDLHGGAIQACMTEIEQWVRAPSRADFLARALAGGRLYGFGHRIHKGASVGDGDATAADPRYGCLVDAAREAFPELAAQIEEIQRLPLEVRRLKPTLLPNTDFGAAVWFRCLGLSPHTAMAFFTMGRLPGLLAQVVYQLGCKANALRPPMAVCLPYGTRGPHTAAAGSDGDTADQTLRKPGTARQAPAAFPV